MLVVVELKRANTSAGRIDDQDVVIGSVLLEDNLLAFQERYQECAKPFEWKYTRKDLRKLFNKLSRFSPTKIAAG